jgi:allophanate hydrolase subunit 2
VLGVDGQTIGGYPRIAQIIRADLDILGQLRPGSKISFTLVTESDAEKYWHDKLKIISTISLQLRTASGLFL